MKVPVLSFGASSLGSVFHETREAESIKAVFTAIENGMKPQTLKVILGHSTLAMTMDLYSHVLPTTKAEEMELIANAF